MNRLAALSIAMVFTALLGGEIVRPPVNPDEFAHRVANELEGGDANGDFRIDGRDVAAYVKQAAFAEMRSHPLADAYVDGLKASLTRWHGTVGADAREYVRRAVAGAEYIALTGDTQFEIDMLTACSMAKILWNDGSLSDYDRFVTNPEPFALKLARAAEINDKARDVLRPLLETLLKQIHDGTHSGSDFGKSTLCRVAIQEALGIPNDRFANYGVNLGLAWMLDHTNNGYCQWLTGSPWYQIFNDVIVMLGWDVRHLMSPAQLRAYYAVYYFPFDWQIDGKSPYVGEDWDKLERELAGGPKWSKSYLLWTGYAWRWLGDDEISTYMRWRALHEIGVATHWNDLKCPHTPDWCPPSPALAEVSNWMPYALAVRVRLTNPTRTVERFYFYSAFPSVDNTHMGLPRERSLMVTK